MWSHVVPLELQRLAGRQGRGARRVIKTYVKRSSTLLRSDNPFRYQT